MEIELKDFFCSILCRVKWCFVQNYVRFVTHRITVFSLVLTLKMHVVVDIRDGKYFFNTFYRDYADFVVHLLRNLKLVLE